MLKEVQQCVVGVCLRIQRHRHLFGSGHQLIQIGGKVIPAIVLLGALPGVGGLVGKAGDAACQWGRDAQLLLLVAIHDAQLGCAEEVQLAFVGF